MQQLISVLLFFFFATALPAQINLELINRRMTTERPAPPQARPAWEVDFGYGKSFARSDLRDLNRLTDGREWQVGLTRWGRNLGWGINLSGTQFSAPDLADLGFPTGSQITSAATDWRTFRLAAGPSIRLGTPKILLAFSPRPALLSTRSAPLALTFADNPDLPALPLYRYDAPEASIKLGYDLNVHLDIKITPQLGIRFFGTQRSGPLFGNRNATLTERQLTDLNGDGLLTREELIESPVNERSPRITERFLTAGIGVTYRLGKRPDPLDHLEPFDTIRINPPVADCECGFTVFRNAEGNYQLRFTAGCPMGSRFQPEEFVYGEIRNGRRVSWITVDLSNSSDQRRYTSPHWSYAFGNLPVLLGPGLRTFYLDVYGSGNPGRILVCGCEQEFSGYPIPLVRADDSRDTRN